MKFIEPEAYTYVSVKSPSTSTKNEPLFISPEGYFQLIDTYIKLLHRCWNEVQ